MTSHICHYTLLGVLWYIQYILYSWYTTACKSTCLTEAKAHFRSQKPWFEEQILVYLFIYLLFTLAVHYTQTKKTSNKHTQNSVETKRKPQTVQ